MVLSRFGSVWTIIGKGTWSVSGAVELGRRRLLQVGVGGCGYCGLWRGVRGSAATRATRCSVEGHNEGRPSP